MEWIGPSRGVENSGDGEECMCKGGMEGLCVDGCDDASDGDPSTVYGLYKSVRST